jgi:BirA family biotin operon repressor/biotin-[acetyl-CoA-carboxylase] ligase
LQIFELTNTKSTNDFLTKQEYEGVPQLCIAENQTGGKGQFGRVWQSQRKSALFSLKIKLPIFDISGLSLVVGISCVQVLEKNYHLTNLAIKWPNDIFLSGRKLGGILIENQIKDDNQFLIIGIGINILSDGFASMNQNINPKQLATRISENILDNLEIFHRSSFEFFLNTWEKYDFLTKNQVKINFENTFGTANGVDKSGVLIWQNSDKQVKIHSSNKIKILL